MRKKEELDSYIERCVMNRVNYKRKIDLNTGEEYYEGTYQLHFFDRDNLEEEEKEYVFNKLNEKNILVVGNSPALYGNFENYKYVVKPMYSNQKDVYDSELLNKIMNEYKTMKKTTEKEKTKADLLRKKIISMNIRLADFMVDKYNKNSEFDPDELLSYAYEGLILAVDNYDMEKGLFSTFALKYIEGYLIRGMKFLRGFSSISFYYKYKNAKESLEEELGIVIENDLEYIDEIATKIYSTYKLPIDNIDDIKTRILLMNELSLEEIDDEVYDDNTLYKEVIEKVNREYMKKDIDKMLSKLTNREKEVITDIYGLSDGIQKEILEVSKNMNCKRQNIYEIEKRAINRLRNKGITSQLETYYASIGEYDYSPCGIEQVKVKQKVK